MKTGRGKAFAFSVVALGVATRAGAGYEFRDLIMERYWLWNLQSKDAGEKRLAVQRLGELRSVRAVPHLIPLLVKPTDNGLKLGAPIKVGGEWGTFAGYWEYQEYVGSALVKIGDSAVPKLLEALDSDNDARFAIINVLGLLGPAAQDAIPALESLLQNPATEEGIRGLIGTTLERIKMYPPEQAVTVGPQ